VFADIFHQNDHASFAELNLATMPQLRSVRRTEPRIIVISCIQLLTVSVPRGIHYHPGTEESCNEETPRSDGGRHDDVVDNSASAAEQARPCSPSDSIV